MSLGAGVNPGAMATLGYPGLVSDFQFADRYDAVGENDRMDVDRLDYDGLEWLEEESKEEEGKRKARAENLLTEVHSGLSALGTTIKIVTALLTVLGADSTRRDDEYEAALSSLLGLGSSMVRLGGTGLIGALASSSSSPSPSSSSSSSSSLSSKLGVAAPIDNVYSKVRLDKEVSDAEALHRKQVAKIVAQLTPEQIAAQQVVVEKHVNGQAESEGLSEVEKIQLQVDTLQHNGLPIPDDLLAKIKSSTSLLSSLSSEDISTNMLGNLIGSAQGLVSSIFSETENGEDTSSSSPTTHTNLPEQGTLEHTIMLNLFNAQQSVNMFLNSIFGDDTPSDPNHIGGGQFVANDKIGEALGDSETGTGGGGLLSMPSKLLRSLPVSPGTAAIGLLTTGAVGSVIYSYAVNAPPGSLATSATSLAKGAVEGLQRRKDEMVAAASSAFARVAGADGEPQSDNELEDEGNYIYYYDDDDSVVYGQYGEGVIGAGRYEGKFSDYGYTFSGAKKDDSFANTKKDTFTDIYSTGAGQSPSVVVYPDYDYQDSIPVRNQPSTPKEIQFYEPTPSVSLTEERPKEYAQWSNGAWAGNTDHLYRKKRDAEDEGDWVVVKPRLAICEDNFMDCKDSRNRKACMIRKSLCRRK